MGLDTLSGIIGGRQEQRAFVLPSVNAAHGGADRLGSYGFPDADLGVAAPGTLAGEFPTAYAQWPALTAPARVVALSAYANVTNRPMNVLLDRAWHSGLITGTGGTINSGNMPARTNNGEGYHLFIAIRDSSTKPGSTIVGTITYTNSAGVAGRVATIPTYTLSLTTGGMLLIPLDTGDTGVKSVESISIGDLAGKSIQLVVSRKVTRENGVQLERAGNSLLPKPTGRLLSIMSEVLPIGTVITPSGHWPTGNPVQTFQYVLAYG